MVESKKALPKEPRMNGLDSSPPHSRVLDNSLHLYTALQGFHRYNTSNLGPPPIGKEISPDDVIKT
jgi:hypothetical protein